MSTPELQRQIAAQVAALTASLAQAKAVDQPTRAQLAGLQKEIVRLCESDVSVTHRLEELAVRFESDHPAAGTALRQAIDALAKVGI